MAKMTISEYADPRDAQGLSGVVSEPAAVVQELTYTGSHAESNAFAATTRVIRINSDSICRFLIGASPTALATSPRSDGSTEYFSVTGGHKISAITST